MYGCPSYLQHLETSEGPKKKHLHSLFMPHKERTYRLSEEGKDRRKGQAWVASGAAQAESWLTFCKAEAARKYLLRLGVRLEDS